MPVSTPTFVNYMVDFRSNISDSDALVVDFFYVLVFVLCAFDPTRC